MEPSQQDKCIKCPFFIEGNAVIDRREIIDDTFIRLSTSEVLEDIPFQVIEAFNESRFDGLVENMTSKDLAKELRTEFSEVMAHNKMFIEGIKNDLGLLALGCYGPLSLRGSRDNRRVYTVTVCTSPGISDEITERAVIKRTKR